MSYDLVGKRFGSLTVIKKCDERKSSKVRWLCKCDCGNYTTPITRRLTKGITTSCGCKRRLTITHGMSKTNLYKTWTSMKKRCFNPSEPCYGRYGGKGITVCDEWKDSFEAFAEWAMSHGYEEGLTIERKDYTKGYSPANCCWIPHDEQARNKSNNVRITYNGETKILAEWCRELGLDYRKISQRRRYLEKKGIDYTPEYLFKKGNLTAHRIAQYDTEGNLIKIWDNISEITETGQFNRSKVYRCCNGSILTCNGYVFRFAD